MSESGSMLRAVVETQVYKRMGDEQMEVINIHYFKIVFP